MEIAAYSDPILSCDDSKVFESSLLGDADSVWRAMRAAGTAIADAVLKDYLELQTVPDHLRVVALIGKGNNGGDALLACDEILERFPRASVWLFLLHDREQMGAACQRAYDRIKGRAADIRIGDRADHATVVGKLAALTAQGEIDICIDGLLGMSFHPPLSGSYLSVITALNACTAIRLKAAVDLPSGLGDVPTESVLYADFTYATGIVKTPVIAGNNACGRVRYLDLGFFREAQDRRPQCMKRVLTPRVLQPLKRLRPAHSDKRSFGHLFIVGGSAFMPGALAMSVQAAVRSGVGLVTAFAPASVAAILAAQVPEAMWVPWPETANGTLNPSADRLFYERLSRADAVLLGPGMGRDRYTEMLSQEIVRKTELPVIVDADALQSKVIEMCFRRSRSMGPVIVTPHAGEFQRIAKQNTADISDEALMQLCTTYQIVTVLKGPITRISDGKHILVSPYGGPILARGGSGDLLGGLLGGMLARDPRQTIASLAKGLLLHGLAAEAIARRHGQVAIRTTKILEGLPLILRSSDNRP